MWSWYRVHGIPIHLALAKRLRVDLFLVSIFDVGIIGDRQSCICIKEHFLFFPEILISTIKKRSLNNTGALDLF